MLMLQLPPAVTLAPQVFVCAKPTLLVMLVTGMLIVFGLVSVTTCGRLGRPTVIAPKLIDAGVNVGGSGAAPVPESAALTLPADVIAVTVAVTAPATVGVNVTVMVHDALAARLDPQVVVWLKPAPGLLMATVMLCGLGLLNVSTRGIALPPTVVVPGKLTGCGASIGGVRGAAVAVPLSRPCAAGAATPRRKN